MKLLQGRVHLSCLAEEDKQETSIPRPPACLNGFPMASRRRTQFKHALQHPPLLCWLPAVLSSMSDATIRTGCWQVNVTKCRKMASQAPQPLKHHPDHPALALLLSLSCRPPFLTGTCDIYLKHSNGSSVPVTPSASMAGIQVRNLPTPQREDFGHSSISSFHNLL